MTLWTIQNIEWYNELMEKGIIYGERKYINEDWEFSLSAYNWLMNKMDEKIGKRPFPECYPVWAWYQYNDEKRRRPDLRSTGFLPKGTKGVRVEITKEDKNVLLSDFMLWHFPFSYQGFIGQNEKESFTFEKMLENKGLDRENLEKLPKHIQKEIIKSWDRVLDLDFSAPYYTHPRKTKTIQATFWTLSVGEIIKVDEFIAR